MEELYEKRNNLKTELIELEKKIWDHPVQKEIRKNNLLKILTSAIQDTSLEFENFFQSLNVQDFFFKVQIDNGDYRPDEYFQFYFIFETYYIVMFGHMNSQEGIDLDIRMTVYDDNHEYHYRYSEDFKAEEQFFKNNTNFDFLKFWSLVECSYMDLYHLPKDFPHNCIEKSIEEHIMEIL